MPCTLSTLPSDGLSGSVAGHHLRHRLSVRFGAVVEPGAVSVLDVLQHLPQVAGFLYAVIGQKDGVHEIVPDPELGLVVAAAVVDDSAGHVCADVVLGGGADACPRSEERRVGKRWVRTCKARGAWSHEK